MVFLEWNILIKPKNINNWKIQATFFEKQCLINSVSVFGYGSHQLIKLNSLYRITRRHRHYVSYILSWLKHKTITLTYGWLRNRCLSCMLTFMIIIKVKVVLHCSRLRLTRLQFKNRGDGRQQVITNIKHWRMRNKGWNKMRKNVTLIFWINFNSEV